jgi:hypothetical protein
MRNGIGATAFAFCLVTAASTACVSGDIDEEKTTESIPAGTDPEAGTFHVARRSDGTQQALVIRLSTISMCERSEVPQSHQFVELELVIPVDAEFMPETCKLDQTFRCRIRLLRTTAPECASSAGPIAAFGHLQIDEVSENVVRGSFVGTNTASKVDLRGSFVAKPCLGADSCP